MKLTDVISKRNVYGADFFGEDISAKTVKLTDNSSGTTLEITQSGTGNSIKTNDGDIKVINGDQTITRYSNTLTDRPSFSLAKARGTSTSPAAVVVDERLGSIYFEGYDGSTMQQTASITALADGSVSAGNIPTRIVIGPSGAGTTGTNTYILIKANGNVGISESNPQAKLHIDGNLRVDGNSTLDGALRLDIGTDNSASAGSATLPANPVGFIEVNINGTNRKIPYYAT